MFKALYFYLFHLFWHGVYVQYYCLNLVFHEILNQPFLHNSPMFHILILKYYKFLNYFSRFVFQVNQFIIDKIRIDLRIVNFMNGRVFPVVFSVNSKLSLNSFISFLRSFISLWDFLIFLIVISKFPLIKSLIFFYFLANSSFSVPFIKPVRFSLLKEILH